MWEVAINKVHHSQFFKQIVIAQKLQNRFKTDVKIKSSGNNKKEITRIPVWQT